MSERQSKWVAAAMSLFALNWVTLCGTILSTISALLILAILVLGFLQLTTSPYLGIMAFMILPAVFIAGLLVIPVGALWERHRIRKGSATAHEMGVYPKIDFNVPHTRHVAIIVIFLTAVNLFIISTVTYQGVLFMDSPTFCGLVCHKVMAPEHTSYLDSPHSQVACVECHIGPGAPWFVRSKISGMGQLVAVAMDSYQRPIPTPVENLRPSRDTCEQCHWPQRFAGDRFKIKTSYQDDEANSPLKTVLLMHIGGADSGRSGIHSWHIDRDKQTSYIATDKTRTEIREVHVANADGSVKVYRREDGAASEAETEPGEERVMDCIDCHNRPTHIFRLPNRALNDALEHGRLDATMPYIKKVGLEALSNAKGDEGDLEKIAKHIGDFYKAEYPDIKQARVTKAIEGVQALYKRNVFPEMNVTWDTYVNHLGHEDSPGCFRCHDDSLTAEDGSVIPADCDLCHTILAWDEEDPEILRELEIE